MRRSMILIAAYVCSLGLVTSWAQDAGLAQPAASGADAAPKTTVSVLFGTEPRRVRATVYHGRKKLGKTPFTHEFKRESGPVDLVFKAFGHLTVNTRVYTFQDAKLIVKMTKN